MPAGLQVFDRNNPGNLLLDTTTRVGTFWGSFSTGGQKTGNIVISSLVGKEAIFIPIKSGSGLSRSGGVALSHNPTTGNVHWETNYSNNVGYAQDTYTVIYGAM